MFFLCFGQVPEGVLFAPGFFWDPLEVFADAWEGPQDALGGHLWFFLVSSRGSTEVLGGPWELLGDLRAVLGCLWESLLGCFGVLRTLLGWISHDYAVRF